MKEIDKEFKVRLIEDPKTLIELDYNELRLEALQNELEREIHRLRLKKIQRTLIMERREIRINEKSSKEKPLQGGPLTKIFNYFKGV